MIKEVLLGKISLTMETGIILRWLKKEGEYVEKGEPLFELETDKAAQVIESFHEGYLKRIVVPEGQEVAVRTVIAYIGDKDDAVPDSVEASRMEGKAAVPSAELGVRGMAERRGVRAGVNASPLAKRLAAELGIDLVQVTGTGPDGRIGKDDVLEAKRLGKTEGDIQAVEEKQAAAQVRVASDTKLSGIRKVVAERMKASFQNAPHIHLELWVNMDEASILRKRYNEELGGKGHLTYTDILVSAAAKTLRKNVRLNATLHGDTVRIFEEINVGVAVATDRGLVVPVIKHADRLDLAELSKIREELVERVKSGKQTLKDIEGGTFTLTNLGMFGIISFKPIINTGQAAILAAGRIVSTPIVDDAGNIIVKPLMNLTLACDHRIVDGAEGAQFLSDLKNLLENPSGNLR
jgi:pyruvate dehydrogenase E2 component (dihydrolipoamide acetyltransferase)